MSHLRAALRAAGLPDDPRQCPHYQRFWRAAPATHKWCQRCGEHKPLEAFHRNSASVSGRAAHCKSCRNKPHDTAPNRLRGRRHDLEAIRYLKATTKITVPALAARFKTDQQTITRVINGEDPWGVAA